MYIEYKILYIIIYIYIYIYMHCMSLDIPCTTKSQVREPAGVRHTRGYQPH